MSPQPSVMTRSPSRAFCFTQSAAASRLSTSTEPGDLSGQLCAGDGGVVGLTAAHDGGDDCHIGDLEHIHKVVEQHLGAAVCKRLVDGDEALVAQFPGGVQGRTQLGGVMSVVIHHHSAVALTVDLETASCALEACGSGGALLHGSGPQNGRPRTWPAHCRCCDGPAQPDGCGP